MNRFPSRFARCLPALVALLLAACDHGLAPPDVPPSGAIRATITYRGAWPPADSLFDLRFVAMPFVPRDTADILDLARIVFSPQPLPYHVSADTVVLVGVPAKTFVYSGVAQRYTSSFVAWRPVGLVEADGRIPAAQNVSAGTYSDVLTVTVEF